jgi:hypothetical protein
VDAPAPHLCADEIADCLDQKGKIARSITGELMWDWGRGLCVIDSPRTQGVCGYVGGAGVDTRDASFNVDTEYGVVMVTSLDDEAPIAQSRSILVTALGRARNTGTVYGRPRQEEGALAPHAHEIHIPPDERVAVLEVGEAPILTEPIRGTLSLKVREPGAAKVHLLDHVGRPTGEIEAKVRDGALVLPMPGEKGALFYHVAW